MPEADDFTPEEYNESLRAEVLLPNMGEMTKATVVGRKRDADGNPIGLHNSNPLLDTRRQCEVEFADGATDVFTANLIAKNIYSQIDAEINSYSIMSEISTTSLLEQQCKRTMVSRSLRMGRRGLGTRLEVGNF